MPKTKTGVNVIVLYPSAFTALGVDTAGKDEVEVSEDQAAWLIKAGYAEAIEPEAGK